jgi:hypothetical protein
MMAWEIGPGVEGADDEEDEEDEDREEDEALEVVSVALDDPLWLEDEVAEDV